MRNFHVTKRERVDCKSAVHVFRATLNWDCSGIRSLSPNGLLTFAAQPMSITTDDTGVGQVDQLRLANYRNVARDKPLAASFQTRRRVGPAVLKSEYIQIIVAAPLPSSPDCSTLRLFKQLTGFA